MLFWGQILIFPPYLSLAFWVRVEGGRHRVGGFAPPIFYLGAFATVAAESCWETELAQASAFRHLWFVHVPLGKT